MKALAIALIAAFSIAGCAPRVAGGDEVSNGGDDLAKRFEAGRARALRILGEVTELAGTDPAVPEFYARERARLAEDVAQTPAYAWSNRNANGACGATAPSPRAPVKLAYETCRTILTTTQAAILIIGESVHHLGVAQDAFTAAVANAVNAAWLRHLGVADEAVRLRFIFEDGRLYAGGMLSRLRANELASGLAREGDASLLAALDARRGQVTAFLHDSRHAWVDELPMTGDAFSECAARSATMDDAIELAYGRCAALVTEKRSAGFLLLVTAFRAILELPHERAVALASLVRAAWSRAGHPDTPHWLGVPPLGGGASVDDVVTPDNAALDSWRQVWTGEEVLSWKVLQPPSDEVRRTVDGFASLVWPKFDTIFFAAYRPDTRSWRRFQTRNVVTDWYRRTDVDKGIARIPDTDRFDISVGYPGGFLTVTQCYRRHRVRGAGQSFDLKTRAWNVVPEDGAPHREGFQLLRIGGEIVLWGGEDCDSRERVGGGARYDLATRRWRALPAPVGHSLKYESVTVGDAGIYVWGGLVGAEEDDSPTDAGWRYDLARAVWERLPCEGAPSPRSRHDAVWTGRYLVILGGEGKTPARSARDDRPIVYHHANDLEEDNRGYYIAPQREAIGGRYDSVTRRWLPMSAQGAPEIFYTRPALGRSTIWAAPNLIHVGKTTYLYHPERDEWTALGDAATPRGRWRDIFWTGMELILWSGSYDVALFP